MEAVEEALPTPKKCQTTHTLAPANGEALRARPPGAVRAAPPARNEGEEFTPSSREALGLILCASPRRRRCCLFCLGAEASLVRRVLR